MKQTCKTELSVCCPLAAYWRDLATRITHARNASPRSATAYSTSSTHLRLALREREAEIASLLKRRKPVAGGYRNLEIRRQA